MRIGIQLCIVIVAESVVILLALFQPDIVSSFRPVVTWGHVNTVIRQGENLTLTCTVYDVDTFTVVRVVHTQGLVNRTVADNYNLKPPYSRLPRYGLAYQVDSPRVGNLVLTIVGVDGEDSGLFSCYKLSGEEKPYEAIININVLVPVTEIYITRITSDRQSHRIRDGDDVMLEENLPLGVGCQVRADRTSIPTELEITIGGEDEMELFDVHVSDHPLNLESGLSANRSVTIATLVTSRPRPHFNGKQIKCAGIRRAYAHLTASANLVVMYVPRIACSRYVIATSKDDTNVTFTCTVRANPSGLVSWRFTDDLRIDLSKESNLIFVNRAILGDSSDVMMTVRSLSKRYWRNYTLSVTNDVGEASTTLALLRRPDPEKPQAPRGAIDVVPPVKLSTSNHDQGALKASANSAAVSQNSQHFLSVLSIQVVCYVFSTSSLFSIVLLTDLRRVL